MLPVSTLFVVPLFAIAVTGIPLSAVPAIAHDATAIGICVGLVVGKVVGIYGTARLAVITRLADLPGGAAWNDMLAVAALGGIGYTVCLVIAQLAAPDVASEQRMAAAILVASTGAALLATALIRVQARRAARD